MAKNIYFILSLTLILFSCGGATRNLTSGQFANSDKYKINNYNGCCGCYAEYFNLYAQGEKKEQIIYKYNCYSIGMPTKFIFNYDENGTLLYCDKFVATTIDDFETVLSDNEKHLFTLLDKDKLLTIGNKIIKFSEIKGFRKAKEGEVTHHFPLIKNGYKATIR